MAKTFSPSDIITRTAGKVFHQTCNFLANTDLQYDGDTMSKYGPDAGSVKIRIPNKFVTGTGSTLTEGDLTEQTVQLQKTTQWYVKLPYYTSEELANKKELTRILQNDIMPAAMSLAAKVESDMLGIAYAGCPYQVGTIGSSATFDGALNAARERLQYNLAPMERSAILTPGMARTIVNDTKGLFQAASNIEKQYREGMLGRTAGFDVYENTLLPRHTSGTSAATGYLINNAATASGATSLVVDTGTGTLVAGDIFNVANVFEVHPETKQATTRLYNFVVSSNFAGGAGSVSVRNPAYDSSGTTAALQNVTALPVDNAAITKVGTASQAYDVGLAFAKPFFAFATRDMIMPNDVHMKSQQTVDGLRIRWLQQYDAVTDKMISRLDILGGGAVVRPEAGCRIAV